MVAVDTRTIGVDAGALSGCPFCCARNAAKPKIGDRIRILTGSCVGMTGTVSKVDLDSRFPEGTFLLRADNDRPGVERIVNMAVDLFQHLSESRTPEWLPPLCLREAGELDDVIVTFCQTCSHEGHWEWTQSAFYEIIRFCWQARLPITKEELWRVLQAHSVPQEDKDRSQHLFEVGTELLVYTLQRKPIKKKRVRPLSEGT